MHKIRFRSSRRMTRIGPVYSSSEMQKLMRFVEVEDPMPASFKNTQGEPD